MGFTFTFFIPPVKKGVGCPFPLPPPAFYLFSFPLLLSSSMLTFTFGFSLLLSSPCLLKRGLVAHFHFPLLPFPFFFSTFTFFKYVNFYFWVFTFTFFTPPVEEGVGCPFPLPPLPPPAFYRARVAGKSRQPSIQDVWFLCHVIALTWWGLLAAQKRFEYEKTYFLFWPIISGKKAKGLSGSFLFLWLQSNMFLRIYE